MKYENPVKLRDCKSVIFLIISEVAIVFIYLIRNSLIYSTEDSQKLIFTEINLYFLPIIRLFGFLAFISIPPLIYSIYWAFKTRSWALRVLTVFGLIALLINFAVAYCNYGCAKCIECSDEECWNSCCWQSWCCRNPCLDQELKKYIPIQITLLLSIFIYGMISADSCLIGLEIPRKSSFDKSFSFFGIISVFISFAVVLYFSMIEGIENVLKLQFDPFLISFIFLTIAVSFLYMVLGYFSQNDCGTPNPFIFSIFAITSFTIGTTLSAFILEVERSIGTLISHWTFFCIWTIFVISMPLFILKGIGGMEKFIIWIFRNFLEKKQKRCSLFLWE